MTLMNWRKRVSSGRASPTEQDGRLAKQKNSYGGLKYVQIHFAVEFRCESDFAFLKPGYEPPVSLCVSVRCRFLRPGLIARGKNAGERSKWRDDAMYIGRTCYGGAEIPLDGDLIGIVHGVRFGDRQHTNKAKHTHTTRQTEEERERERVK